MLGVGAVLDGAGQVVRPPDPPIRPPVPKEFAGASTPGVIGFKDLETWTRDVGMAPDTELGIGLHLSGPSGMVQVSFAVTRLRATPNTPPKDVAVALVPAFDPGRVRWASLSFLVTNQLKRRTTIDASDRVSTYPPGPFGPGDSPVNAVASLTAEEFGQIADALELKATVLGLQADVRADQLKALKAFADRNRLPAPRRRVR